MVAQPERVLVAAALQLKVMQVYAIQFLMGLGAALGLVSCCEKLYDQQLKVLYQNSVPLIKPSELVNRQAAGEKIYLLDIRSEPEYNVSHLPGALFMDYNTLNLNKLHDIPAEATIVVYCTVGVRSEKVGLILKKAGYQQVYNLYGGIIYWKNKGLGIVDNYQKVTSRVHTYNRYWSVWLTEGVKVYE